MEIEFTSELNTEGEAAHKSQIEKYLGAWLDSELTLKTHVKKKCASAMLNLQRIKNIQKFLTKESCTILVVSLCLSHLDYSNSILYSLPNYTIEQMQNIENYGAKLVLGKNRYDSNREALAELHWLPIKARIKFKIFILVFKCLTGEALNYLSTLVVRCLEQTHNLISNNIKDKLSVPKTVRQTFTSRSFSVVGPILWNRLPNHIKSSNSLELLKNSTHSYLPTSSYTYRLI